jgi:hypothetical protein
MEARVVDGEVPHPRSCLGCLDPHRIPSAPRQALVAVGCSLDLGEGAKFVALDPADLTAIAHWIQG